jgi:hypothetical protein
MSLTGKMPPSVPPDIGSDTNKKCDKATESSLRTQLRTFYLTNQRIRVGILQVSKGIIVQGFN